MKRILHLDCRSSIINGPAAIYNIDWGITSAIAGLAFCVTGLQGCKCDTQRSTGSEAIVYVGLPWTGISNGGWKTLGDSTIACSMATDDQDIATDGLDWLTIVLYTY